MNDPSFRQIVNQQVSQARNPAALLKALGRELGNVLKQWFRRKDQTDINKLAPDRREHFWLGVARAVQAPVIRGAKSVSVTINHPAIAQKIFGGPIVAKRAGALTIPVNEKAYGRTTATFERETGLKLFLVRQKNSTSNSAIERAVLAANVGGKLEVEYLLTPRVNQKPDPTALPPQKQMEEALIARGQAVLDRQAQEK